MVYIIEKEETRLIGPIGPQFNNIFPRIYCFVLGVESFPSTQYNPDDIIAPNVITCFYKDTYNYICIPNFYHYSLQIRYKYDWTAGIEVRHYYADMHQWTGWATL